MYHHRIPSDPSREWTPLVEALARGLDRGKALAARERTGATDAETSTTQPTEVNMASTGVSNEASIDPDDNGWLLQEITTRLPGREWED
jgi:hypothetical protein